MGAGTVTVSMAGIQRWIVGGFTELRMIRGGSELLKNSFEALASDAEARNWEVVSATSGSLTVFTNKDVEAAGRDLAAQLRRLIPDAPINVRFGFEKGTGNVERIGLPGYPPSLELCAYSGEAAATGWITHVSGKNPASKSVHQRRDAVAGMGSDGCTTFDLNKIGPLTTGRFSGYIAVIVADGDGIGMLVANAWREGREAVRALNMRLAREVVALIDAARTSGQEMLGDEFLWNPVITGGDDITLVVPAVAAIPVAVTLMSAPQVDGGPGMQASCAVFLCKASYPFHVAWEAAEHLLAETKDHTRAEQKPMAGIKFELGSIAAAERWRFPTEAYSRDQLIAMWQWATSPRSVSSSRLRHLAESTAAGGRIAVREWQLTTGPRNAIDDPTGLRTVLREFQSADAPFGDNGVSSPIGDLIDLRSLAYQLTKAKPS